MLFNLVKQKDIKLVLNNDNGYARENYFIVNSLASFEFIPCRRPRTLSLLHLEQYKYENQSETDFWGNLWKDTGYRHLGHTHRDKHSSRNITDISLPLISRFQNFIE